MGFIGALNQSRVVLPLPKRILSSFSLQEPSSHDDDAQVTILDFNPNLASFARGRTLHTVKGKLDDEIFSEHFERPSEATDGVAFTVLGPVHGVGPDTRKIYLTRSAIILDRVSVFHVTNQILTPERETISALSGWERGTDED